MLRIRKRDNIFLNDFLYVTWFKRPSIRKKSVRPRTENEARSEMATWQNLKVIVILFGLYRSSESLSYVNGQILRVYG